MTEQQVRDAHRVAHELASDSNGASKGVYSQIYETVFFASLYKITTITRVLTLIALAVLVVEVAILLSRGSGEAKVIYVDVTQHEGARR